MFLDTTTLSAACNSLGGDWWTRLDFKQPTFRPLSSILGLQFGLAGIRIISYLQTWVVVCIHGWWSVSFMRLQKLILSVGALARTFYTLLLLHLLANFSLSTISRPLKMSLCETPRLLPIQLSLPGH